MSSHRRVVNQGRSKQGVYGDDDDDGDSRGRSDGRQNENLLSATGKPLEMRTVILMTTLTDSICRIDTGTHTGTGYMVRIPIGDYGELYGMLTNNHVIGKSQLSSGRKWNLEFTAMDGLNYDWNSSDWVYMFTDQRLDCTFVVPQPSTIDELDQKGIDFMPAGVERVGERVGVIQHPQGGELSFSYGKIVRMDHLDMYHNADTMSGSSGSPLINSKGEVIGLHKAWEQDSNLNLATRITTVVDAIRADFCNQPNLGVARKGGPHVNRDPQTGKIVTTDPALALRVSRRDPAPPSSRGGGGPSAYQPSSPGHYSSGGHKPQAPPRPPPPRQPNMPSMPGFGNIMADLDDYFKQNFPMSMGLGAGGGGGGGSTTSYTYKSNFSPQKPMPRRRLAPLRFDFFGEAHESSSTSDRPDDDHRQPAGRPAGSSDYAPQPPPALPNYGGGAPPPPQPPAPGMPVPDYWSQPQQPAPFMDPYGAPRPPGQAPYGPQGGQQLPYPASQGGGPVRPNIGWAL